MIFFITTGVKTSNPTTILHVHKTYRYVSVHFRHLALTQDPSTLGSFSGQMDSIRLEVYANMDRVYIEPGLKLRTFCVPLLIQFALFNVIGFAKYISWPVLLKALGSIFLEHRI
jgi:hypothetical protein